MTFFEDVSGLLLRIEEAVAEAKERGEYDYIKEHAEEVAAALGKSTAELCAANGWESPAEFGEMARAYALAYIRHMEKEIEK